MPKRRKTTHVVPNSSGGWDVKKGGQNKPVTHHDTKSDAIKSGRKPAKIRKASFTSIVKMENSSAKTAMVMIQFRQKDDAPVRLESL